MKLPKLKIKMRNQKQIRKKFLIIDYIIGGISAGITGRILSTIDLPLILVFIGSFVVWYVVYLVGLLIILPVISQLIIFEINETNNKNENIKGVKDNPLKEEYCVECGRPFTEVKRFENTNLCETCFNKNLKD